MQNITKLCGNSIRYIVLSWFIKAWWYNDAYFFNYASINRMAWQWAETLVEIRVTLADIRGTTK